MLPDQQVVRTCLDVEPDLLALRALALEERFIANPRDRLDLAAALAERLSTTVDEALPSSSRYQHNPHAGGMGT